MNNILILYNPYYQSDIIQKHLEVLLKNEKVAFGKIRSKLKNSDITKKNLRLKLICT